MDDQDKTHEDIHEEWKRLIRQNNEIKKSSQVFQKLQKNPKMNK